MAEVFLLRDKPYLAGTAARWTHDQWYRNRNIDESLLVKYYEKIHPVNALPITWIALENDIPAGIITLKENDLQSRMDLNPWLSTLYVSPEFRNRGIGEMLIRTVIEKARGLFCTRIYLFLGGEDNNDLARYYSGRGWIFLDDAMDNDGKDTKIFYNKCS
jgi:GNAT superfamily N-acetyltransferase